MRMMWTERLVSSSPQPLGPGSTGEEFLSGLGTRFGLEWSASLQVLGPVQVGGPVALPIDALLSAHHMNANNQTASDNNDEPDHSHDRHEPRVVASTYRRRMPGRVKVSIPIDEQLRGQSMRSVTYSMGVSLDGYIAGPDGGFDWTEPDEEVFRFVTDEIREVGVHLLGRRLYETMLYWETADQDPSLDDSVLDWAAIWKPLPKVVFSTTLSAVQGNARLASASLAEEIERLRAEPGEGDIAIGGASLAAEAAALGLIDEYRARVYPVLVGGGVPFFSQRGHRVDLELVESRTFNSSVLYLRYRVTR